MESFLPEEYCNSFIFPLSYPLSLFLPEETQSVYSFFFKHQTPSYKPNLYHTLMLGIILSHQQLAAGHSEKDKNQFLSWEQKDQWIKDIENPVDSLPELIFTILDKARKASWFKGSEEQPCPILVSTVQYEKADFLRASLEGVLAKEKVKDFFLARVEALEWSFLAGLDGYMGEGEKAVVLEGIGSHASWREVEHRSNVEKRDPAEIGAADLFKHEKISGRKLAGIGRSSGREKVMATLMKQFSEAGISLDAETQTSLGEQVNQEPIPGTFNISRETGNIILQAEASFNEEEISELMLGEYNMLRPQLKKDVLHSAGITNVWLMGPHFYHPAFISFLKDECRLEAELKMAEKGTVEEIFDLSMKGLSTRTALITEAEAKLAEAIAKQKEAEEKKAAIAAELKMKDERDLFLQEIKDVCIDPSKKEEYEGQFVSRGEALGIPDLVIKWNITEALSRVELVQEGEQIGLEVAESSESEEASTPAPVEETPAEEPEVIAPPVANKSEDKPEKEEKGKEESNEPSPEPVAEKKETEKTEKAEEVLPQKSEAVPAKEAEPVMEPVLQAAPVAAGVAEAVKPAPVKKASRKREQVALEDIFSFKGDLPDLEFVSRKATFHQDNDVKVIRLLPKEKVGDASEVEKFKKVHAKELAYFGDLSEISESKDGMYFYRKYIERQTLKDYAGRNGLANKKSIEDLSSGDLKFILSLLKEVQELPVTHGDLTAENILIVNKRKWNLSKDLEVKFVGFHSREVSTDETINQAHKALGAVIGEDVYKEFKEKFQL